MRRLDPLALSNLSLPAKWVGAFMAHHENRNGEVITTPLAIRAWTGLHRVTIYDGISELEGSGFLTVISPFKPGPKSTGRFAPTWGVRSLQQPTPTESVVDNNQLVSGDAETADSLASAQVCMSLSSPGIKSSPEVLANKELGQEGLSNTQGDLIPIEAPAWLNDLRTAPGYDVDRVHEMKLIDRVRDAGISPARLCETAAAIAAKWESIRWSPSNKGGYKRIDLTFIAWAKRESFNGAKSTNGRYVAPGTSIPKGGTPEAHARWPEQTYDDDGNVLTTRW